MTISDWTAAFVLLFLLPIPIFWLVLHPFAGRWRIRGKRAAYSTALPVAAASSLAIMYFFREPLLTAGDAPPWAVALGVVCIVASIFVFVQVEKQLGTDRLLGKVELSGGGELRTTGLYARIRHPSYLAQMCAMLGACLLAGTRVVWLAGGGWLLLQLVMIRFEERELRARFGGAYDEYRKRVPAFIPRW